MKYFQMMKYFLMMSCRCRWWCRRCLHVITITPEISMITPIAVPMMGRLFIFRCQLMYADWYIDCGDYEIRRCISKIIDAAITLITPSAAADDYAYADVPMMCLMPADAWWCAVMMPIMLSYFRHFQGWLRWLFLKTFHYHFLCADFFVANISRDVLLFRCTDDDFLAFRLDDIFDWCRFDEPMYFIIFICLMKDSWCKDAELM